MRTATLIIIAGCLMFAISLIQVSTTGMYEFYEYNLEGYPYYFFTGRTFNAFIIKGETRDSGEISAANLIINSIPEQFRLLSEISYPGHGFYQTRIFPEELQGSVKIFNKDRFDYRIKNGIVIGTPCNNALVPALLGNPDCRAYFEPGQGMVKLVEAHSHIYVVITGYGDQEVWATANAFVDGINRGTIRGKEFRTRLQTAYEGIQVPNFYIGETIGKELPAVY